jgi:hypothetical protein
VASFEQAHLAYTSRELQELPSVISAPRFATYLQVRANDRAEALALYDWNLAVSAAFLVPLQICEVAMRNGVAEAVQRVHGATWPWSNGFLRSLPRPRRQSDYNPEADLRAVAARQPTTGKVIADLKFAFWENLFTAGQDDRLWAPNFRAAFPDAPSATPVSVLRANAFRDLQLIRRFRNRIAHHEPIFKRNLTADYQRLHDLVGWRSQTAAQWMHRRQHATMLISLMPT